MVHGSGVTLSASLLFFSMVIIVGRREFALYGLLSKD